MVIKEYNIQKKDLVLRVSLSSFENISLIFKYLFLRKNNTPLKTAGIKTNNIVLNLYCIKCKL